MRIPFSSKAKQFEPLRNCLHAAAVECGLSDYTTALLVSAFFEGVADEVSKGRVVRIPGFGIFAAYRDERAFVLARDPLPRCRPAFSPSRGFREQVKHCAPPNLTGKVAIEGHRRRHSLGGPKDEASRRVFSAMEAFRERIRAQMRERGIA